MLWLYIIMGFFTLKNTKFQKKYLIDLISMRITRVRNSHGRAHSTTSTGAFLNPLSVLLFRVSSAWRGLVGLKNNAVFAGALRRLSTFVAGQLG